MFNLSVHGGVQITKNAAIFSGRPVIGGHRITVHDVPVQVRAGVSADEVARGYCLPTDESAAALAYYEEYKTTIDRQIAADNREFARLAAAETSPVADRMGDIGNARVHILL